MADETLNQLVTEMRQNNALTMKLLDEKKLDDTPQQLFAGNLFEILAQYDIYRMVQKKGTPISKEVLDENDEDSLSNNIAGGLLGQSNQPGGLAFVGFVLQEILDIVGSGLTLITFNQGQHLKFLSLASNLNAAQKKFADKEVTRAERNFGRLGTLVGNSIESIQNIAKDNTELLSFLKDETKEELPEQDGKIKITATYADGREMENPARTSTAKSKEAKKDERSRLQIIADKITSPIKTIGEGLAFMGEKLTVKNAALATVMAALLTGLIAFVPIVAQGAATILTAFGSLLSFDFGKAITLFIDNIGATLVTASLIFGPITFAKFLGKFILKFMAGVGLLLLKTLPLLSPKVIVGAIIVTIIAFFKDLILDTLGYLGQKFKEFIGFADTDFGQEAKDFYGNLLSGGGTDAAEKLVTTGPPLLVPPTAVPDFISAAAPNLIVNNNQVNQTSSSTTQQMSNVTIIDRQQEQSGL